MPLRAGGIQTGCFGVDYHTIEWPHGCCRLLHWLHSLTAQSAGHVLRGRGLIRDDLGRDVSVFGAQACRLPGCELSHVPNASLRVSYFGLSRVSFLRELWYLFDASTDLRVRGSDERFCGGQPNQAVHRDGVL